MTDPKIPAPEPVAWANHANLISAKIARERKGNAGASELHTWREGGPTDYHGVALTTLESAETWAAAREAAARMAAKESMRANLSKGVKTLVDILRAGENFYGESSLFYDRKLAEAVDVAADVIEHLTAELATKEAAARAENKALRALLAYRVAGAMLYRDDGELQDNTQHPCIDFKRDSVEEIDAKLRQRMRANYLRTVEEDAAREGKS